MGLKPIKITIELFGDGLVWDPGNPTHLDGVLAWCLAPMQVPPGLQGQHLRTEGERPDVMGL